MNDITDSMEMSLSKLQEMVKDREAWHACSPWGHIELDTTEQLNNNNNAAGAGRPGLLVPGTIHIVSGRHRATTKL